MDAVILGNTGVEDNAVVVANWRSHFIINDLFICLVDLYLLEISAISLDLIIEIFAAELNLAAHFSCKTLKITCLGVVSVYAVLVSSRTKTSYLT